MNAVDKSLACIVMIYAASAAGNISAKDLWVSKIGSDSSDCSNRKSQACLTIQKAISISEPGDTVNILRGTYAENSANSPHTKKCSWMDGLTASLCLSKSGTKEKQITIQAAPGDEGLAILDSENKRVGLQTGSHDHITVRGLTFVNSRVIAIASWGQATVAIPDEKSLGIGLVIENNKFFNTTGPAGVNSSAIGMWGSKDWEVRNNFIDGVYGEGGTLASGIQAYGVLNALIENNEIYNTGFGIYWKSHHIADKERTPVFESEIRYNIINASASGIYIGSRPGEGPEAGNNYIHHNIIYGYSRSGYYGNVAATKYKSGYIRIENNVFDGEAIKGNSAITLDGQGPANILGNIIIRNSIDIEVKKYSDKNYTVIENIDYNVYDLAFQAIVDRYSDKSLTVRSLAAWVDLVASSAYSLGVDAPDKRSISQSPDEIFESLQDKNYRLAPDSEARKLMPGGSNAGAQQTGQEEVGILRAIINKHTRRAPDPQ